MSDRSPGGRRRRRRPAHAKRRQLPWSRRRRGTGSAIAATTPAATRSPEDASATVTDAATGGPRPDPHLRRSIVKGSAWALGGKVLGLVTGIGASVVLARLLSPPALGNYFVAVNLAMIAKTIAQLGTPQAALRMIAESVATGRTGRARSAARSALLTVGAGSALIGLFLLSPPGRSVVETFSGSTAVAKAAVVVVVLMVALTFEFTLGEVFRGLRVISLATVVGGTFSAVVSAAGFVVLERIEGRVSFTAALAVLAGATATAVAVGLVLLPRKLPARAGDRSTAGVRELVNVGWFFLANNVMTILLNNSDIWALSSNRGASAVAVYGQANRLTTLLSIPSVVMGAVVPPVIAGLHARGDLKRLERVLRVSATVVAVPGAILLAGFAIVGGPLLALLFGEFYRASYQPFLILGAGILISNVTGACGLTLAMTGHQRELFLSSAAAGLLTVGAAIVGAHIAGASGVAVARSTGIALQNLTQVWFVHRLVGVRTFLDFTVTRREIRSIVKSWRSGR